MPTTIETYPLEKNKIIKRFISAMTGWGVLLFIIGIALIVYLHSSLMLATGVWIFLAILLAAWQYVYETKYFEAYFYDAQPDFLVIKKGWITPKETTLPYEKLQDVYVDQDIYDRIFGLVDVHVSTATMASGMEAHIDGVNPANANKLRELILAKIQEKKGKR